MLLIVIEN